MAILKIPNRLLLSDQIAPPSVHKEEHSRVGQSLINILYLIGINS